MPAKRFDEYVPLLPSVILTVLSVVFVRCGHWLRTFDDSRPDL